MKQTLLKSLTGRLAVSASLAFAASGAMATPVAIDTSNAANGPYDIYSVTFDGALSPCGGGSPTYCSFFGGDPLTGRAFVISPNPTGVDTNSPVAIGTAHTAAGSFLDIDLTSGYTVAQIVGTSTISLPTMVWTLSGSTIIGMSGAGFAILPSATASVNGLGQVEFLVNNSPGLAADFSTLSSVVTSCTGPLCTIPDNLTDMVRYRLFLDFDPTFTSFTGNFIGQTANDSLVYATLNSAAVPAPATVWLLGAGCLGLMGVMRRKIGS